MPYLTPFRLLEYLLSVAGGLLVIGLALLLLVGLYACLKAPVKP